MKRKGARNDLNLEENQRTKKQAKEYKTGHV